MSYLALKHLHITLASLSIVLFTLRGGLALAGSPWRQRWPVLRWLPHAVDATLLLAGLSLMVWSGQYPGAAAPWLAPKLGLLLAYIGLGKQALQPGVPTARRWAWLLAAWAVVGVMVALAWLKPSF